MSNFGVGLAGFVNGLSGGISLGRQLRQIMQDEQIAKVREQGIAEAKELQDKATPQIQDLGDQQNLTSNPQASMDPNAATPVNTDINKIGLQPQADQSPDAVQTSPVAAPDVQDTSQLSDRPLASAAPPWPRRAVQSCSSGYASGAVSAAHTAARRASLSSCSRARNDDQYVSS